MTNTIATEQLKAALSYLEREISGMLVKALSAEFGEGVVKAAKSESKAPAQDSFCVKHEFEPAEFGSVLFAMERSSAVKLEEQRLREALIQLGAPLASALSARLKREIHAAAPIEEATSATADPSVAIKLMIGDDSVDIIACASPEFLEALALDADAGRNALVPVAAVAARNLDLLLDVEMPVSISFGRAQLPLKDVFKLTIGSMVELNRAISEPVEVIVNNSVIAQGEVVVVEGNFGVRITHVMSKRDRIRSLT
jgi:flagellar motor switch protein FliN